MASESPREDEIGRGWTIGTFLVLAVVAVLWAPFWGMEHIPFRALWGDVRQRLHDWSKSSGSSASRGC